MKNVGDSYDVQFIKQILVHPKDRLARATKKAQCNDFEFAKQVPVYPRDRLTRAAKKDVEFLKHTFTPQRYVKEKNNNGNMCTKKAFKIFIM